MSTLPLWALLLFGVVLPSTVAAGLAYGVRRTLSTERLSANNDLAAITYPVVGLVYGVFLAFAIAIVWQRFCDAESATFDEVTSLNSVWHDVGALPSETRVEIRGAIKAYVAAVQTNEWPAMARARADATTDDAYSRMWALFYRYQPATAVESTYYTQALDDLDAVSQHRRERLLHSESEMPRLLWWFLCFGACITVVCAFFIGTRNVGTHVAMCGAITSLICFSLVIVLCLSRPFAGDVNIKPTPYADLLQSLGPE